MPRRVRHTRHLTAYHGTTSRVADALLEGRAPEYRRVFVDANVSLGGTYLAKSLPLARVCAEQAACELGGRPVVLEVRVRAGELLPDEDWVVGESRLPESTPRAQAFLDDLFVGYLGDGWSLSDHYKARYDELNARHGISWRDSWNRDGTARLGRLLRPEDVLAAVGY